MHDLIGQYIEIPFYFLPLLGFTIGLLSGLLGVGCGWLMTPTLNIIGLPMITAVGTKRFFRRQFAQRTVLPFQTFHANAAKLVSRR